MRAIFMKEKDQFKKAWEQVKEDPEILIEGRLSEILLDESMNEKAPVKKIGIRKSNQEK